MLERTTVTALLGPTNTGKTHRAVERMLDHSSGMIGLPLRLLAREVYDRVTARIGRAEVALVTGEEKLVPTRARYFVCTVEAMPMAREVDFLAVDEIQLAAHHERGHVFTDRLLHARGRVETWFMGAETMRPLIQSLLPHAEIRRHPRLSRLTALGASTLGQLPPRSAVVAFSMARVYEIAERLKQRRGGAAVVLGALSPRARNAQVAMYQAGEVDHMVATDAIGMGLNLDLEHVAFADLDKFDGREARGLEAAELGQIAGRAGRYTNDGTFGTLKPLGPLPDHLARAVERHSFTPERRLVWRSSDLDLASVDALVDSLRRPPDRDVLKLVERADDFSALVALAKRPEIRARAGSRDGVTLLWEACQIPDYQGLMPEAHARLVGEIFLQLSEHGYVDTDWLATQVERLNDPSGDIDTLLQRMAFIRTWTYVSSHGAWVRDPGHWQARTRAIEDALSDALHARLVERFVEKAKPGKPRSRDLAVAAGPFARLLELRSSPVAAVASDDDVVSELADAPHERFRVDARGRLFAGERPLAVLTRGPDPLRPEVRLELDDASGPGARSRLQRRLVAWSRDLTNELFKDLSDPRLETLSAAGRGLLYQLRRELGTLERADADAQVVALGPDDHALLSELGVVLGRRVIYLRSLLRPRAIEQRAALLSAWSPDAAPSPPPPGSVSFAVPTASRAERRAFAALGYPVFGPRAVRADVVERVVERLGAGVPDAAGIDDAARWLGAPRRELVGVLHALGFDVPRPTRPRRRPRRRVSSGGPSGTVPRK